MASPQSTALADMIRSQLPGHGHDPAAALATVRKQITVFGAGPDEDDIAAAMAIIDGELKEIEILKPGSSMYAKRPDWYGGPRQGDIHWPAHRSFLENVKKWHPDTIGSIDRTSTEVVALLDDPRRDTFSCRGLVVGHVQSGKTANMTAVIAKAVDAGYSLIVILAGLTDKLRQQTQGRMESDLVNCHPMRWHRLTTTDIKGDFRKPAHGALMFHTDRAQIAILKKNRGPLDQLLKTVKATAPVELKRLRVLLIDDEADQASPNAASKELDMTAINERIREIVKAFPAISYVGYTATPFANVFIDPYAQHGDDLDDLYPKDFITALPRPQGYFGTEQLFGRPPVDAEVDEEGEDGLDMIRSVAAEDERRLQPPNRKEKDAFRPERVPSLERAVLYYLACCAARRARGHTDKHMTMLVHTSAWVVLHERLASMIAAWVEVISADLKGGTGPVSMELRDVWAEEADRLPNDITVARRIGIDEIFEHLPAVLERLEVVIENGASADRIDYTRDAKTYIVVGGSVLARGLTLEGLMVSYFLRTANQYDTLLQMGRWFGYRHGYEDLPRIWMPDGLRQQFRALAAIEAEIRDEIADYAKHGETPMDFAVKVRAIPGMAITAASKMKRAVKCDVSFWGRHVQTIRFDHRDNAVIDGNWQAADHLLKSAASLGIESSREDGLLLRDVPKATVLQFLREYRTSWHKDFSAGMLAEFVEAATRLLGKWNIGVFEPKGAPKSVCPLGPNGPVGLNRRSRMKGSGENGPADIKALMSRRDVLFDCPPDMEKPSATDWDALKDARRKAGLDLPLLLLYSIEARSEPKSKNGEPSKNREPLDAAGDLVGFGIVFPGSRDKATEYYSVEISGPSAEEIEEAEAEGAESTRAAGIVE